jgi:hypothetical protein
MATACSPLSYIVLFDMLSSQLRPRCSPPAKPLSNADLVGTWTAGSPEHFDELTIRPDNTYRQTVHVELSEGPPIEYQGDWQAWALEYSETGIPYLHLTGMRFCGVNPDIPCETQDGDGYDFCKDQYLPMNGEGILIVLETAGDPSYRHLDYPLGSQNSYSYGLQE